VSVSAKDKATNKEQKMQIQPSGGLSEADIQRMVKEAEEHAGDDKKRRELAEAKNQAEALINQTEKQVVEHSDKISAADKSAIEAAIADLKSVTGSENVAEIATKTQALMQAAMKIGEAIYANPSSGGDEGGGGGGGDSSNEPGVVDAEFEEVDGQSKKSA
jgi:molecular chaperone DnaK